MFNIAFRADGGIQVGLGHLMRCISLADEFREKGNAIYFISNDEHEILIKHNLEIINISSEKEKENNLKQSNDLINESNTLINILEKYKIDCLIVDHYGVSLEFFLKIKSHVKILAYIDDLCVISPPIDFIINGNVFASKKNYLPLQENSEYLLGPDYTLFRKEFKELSKRNIKKEINKILITTGGSDNHDLIPRFLNIFTTNELTRDLHYKVIVNHNFKNLNDITRYCNNFINVELLYNVTNMAEIMQECDLALSTSGVTLYELAITGTPSITFIVADNQIMVGEKMNKINCTVNLGWHDKLDDTQIIDKFIIIIKDYKLRKNLSKNGQKIFDGKGAHRCVNKILKSLYQN